MYPDVISYSHLQQRESKRQRQGDFTHWIGQLDRLRAHAVQFLHGEQILIHVQYFLADAAQGTDHTGV